MRFLASFLQVVGAVSLIVAGFLVGPIAGFVVSGFVALVGGVVVELEVQRGTSKPPSH